MIERARTRLAAACLALAIAASALAPAAAYATPASAAPVALSGVMRDLVTGDPLAGTVTVRSARGVTVAAVAVSANGSIDALVPLERGATYTLEYDAPGYAADSSVLRADAETLRIDPALAKAGVTRAVSFEARSVVTASAVSTYTPPATIRVYRKKLGRVDVVPFKDYVKHVLPCEWYSTWEQDSLMAGAVAAKNYAWYWVVQTAAGAGKWSQYAADVVDDTYDQVYDPAVSAASTDAAVEATWDWRLVKSGKLLQSQYVAGSRGQDRDANYPTRLSQWGTQYWAGLGFGWRWILQHYYGDTELQLPVSSTRAVRFTPLAGADRYVTAVEVSKHAFPAGAAAAVIAVGASFPDALCAAPLARAVRGPVLLTRTADLDPATVAELQRLSPAQVYIIGSEASVSAVVETHVRALGIATVARLGGADRFETAAKVAEALRAKAGRPARVVVANGSGFADALSAAPLAAAKGWPILLTKTAALPTATVQAVRDSGASASLVMGREDKVSRAVADALPSAYRLGGADRYATCGLLADFAKTQGVGYGRIGLATGLTFPDALSAGPLLAADNGLLLLASGTGLPASLSTRVAANKAAVSEVHLVGKDAVPETAVSGVEAALR